MENFFDKSLHFLGKQNKEVFVLNIGAMDGVMFDEMIGYTTSYNFKGLYVEPIPYLFEKLKNNIPGNNFFENSAISDYNGTIKMQIIDPEVIDKGLVHPCFYGMSAVYPPKNGLGSEFDRPTVEKYGMLVDVPCITFNTLMEKHNISKFDVVKIDAEGHDYHIFKQIDLKKYRPSVIRIEWINLTNEQQSKIINLFDENNYKYEINGQDIIGLSFEIYKELENIYDKPKCKTTLVTGLWDIKRSELSDGWSRTYNHYLDKFSELLKCDYNLIIFGDEELQKFVSERRSDHNTQFVLRNTDWFTNNQYYDKIQKLRVNPNWYNQSGWLSESTQAKLDMYNPLVMSKMFLLNDASILDKFNSEFLFWIDGGITNTVNVGYFTYDKVIDKLENYVNKFSFVCFPYDAVNEIHGFSCPKINNYAQSDVKLVPRGGFFGGKKDYINQINQIYYSLLMTTLDDGYMGTEESLFSIINYKHNDLVDYFEINYDGLLFKFFEDLKNGSLVVKNTQTKKFKTPLKLNNIALYVIGFNSPKQLETLIESMLSYDRNFIDKPKKYLLNNSTDRSTDVRYNEICNLYNFEIIWPNDNLGICGGRQFIAEHSDENNFDAYYFFEDDMFFYPKKGEVCRNGFNRYVDNLYENVKKIVENECYDFLKLNFSEFFGDNSTQWSWYNVPQVVREELFPDNKILPVSGLDPNAPKTKFNNIKSLNGIPYTDGEVFYCNWPQLVTKEGNKKMFLTTKWDRPFEQTWMSYIYQETLKGNINPSILLMTPTEHNRFEHYSHTLRKES
jgi:FkbM family methyltransferase